MVDNAGGRPARPLRVIIGLGVMLASLGAFALLVADAAQRDTVLVLARGVDAGDPIEADDLRVIELAADEAVAHVDAAQRDAVVGQYARFALAEGALLAPGSVQATRLVTPGYGLVAVEVSAGAIPGALAVGDHVAVVALTTDRANCGDEPSVVMTDAVIAAATGGDGRPRTRSSAEVITMSVEVPLADLAAVVSADRVSIAGPGRDDAIPSLTASTPTCGLPEATTAEGSDEVSPSTTVTSEPADDAAADGVEVVVLPADEAAANGG